MQLPKLTRASLGTQLVKNPPAVQEMQETQIQSLGREDPLEEGMAAHSSILAWQATVHGVTKRRTRLSDLAHTHTGT